MKCIIEVGLSIGDDFSLYVTDPSADYVFGFEPVPHLAKHVRNRCASVPTTTPYEVIQKAVDIDDNPKTFYPATTDYLYMDGVAGRGWMNGAGSLLKMEDHLSQTWPNRPDLKQIDSDAIEVECTRLDTFIKERGVDEIQMLEIDAQGKDLDVLKSLGDYISIVKNGKIEVPETPEVALYKDNHNKEETLHFLLDHGFSVEQENVNLQNEENFIFYK